MRDTFTFPKIMMNVTNMVSSWLLLTDPSQLVMYCHVQKLK